MPQDKEVAKYLAVIRIEVQAINRYGDTLNDETHIEIVRSMDSTSIADIVERFEKA